MRWIVYPKRDFVSYKSGKSEDNSAYNGQLMFCITKYSQFGNSGLARKLSKKHGRTFLIIASSRLLVLFLGHPIYPKFLLVHDSDDNT